MPDDEPKSAWEIALEKMKSRGGYEVESLTDAQKAEIGEIRKRYRAKLAEVEIRQQDQRRKTLEQGTTQEELDKLEKNFARERDRLRSDEETAIRKVRENKE